MDRRGPTSSTGLDARRSRSSSAEENVEERQELEEERRERATAEGRPPDFWREPARCTTLTQCEGLAHLARAAQPRLRLLMFAGTAAVLTGFVLAAYFADVLQDSSSTRSTPASRSAASWRLRRTSRSSASTTRASRSWASSGPSRAPCTRRRSSSCGRTGQASSATTFSSRSLRRTRRTNEELAEAIAQAGNVVLATTIVNDRGSTNVFGGDDVLHCRPARPTRAMPPTRGAWSGGWRTTSRSSTRWPWRSSSATSAGRFPSPSPMSAPGSTTTARRTSRRSRSTA